MSGRPDDLCEDGLIGLGPVSWRLENFCEYGLPGAGLRDVHVLPGGVQRQGHQEGLVAHPRGEKAELCAPGREENLFR